MLPVAGATGYGEVPWFSDSVLVAVITEAATVVTSWIPGAAGCVFAPVSVAWHEIVAVLPLTAEAGTVPATQKRNCWPAPTEGVTVIGTVSGLPALSPRYCMFWCGRFGPAKLVDDKAPSV